MEENRVIWFNFIFQFHIPTEMGKAVGGLMMY